MASSTGSEHIHAAAAAALLCLTLALPRDAAAEESLEPLSFVALGGGERKVAPEGNEIVVVHFWATWCPSCVTELADLERASRECKDDGVRVVLVNVGEEPEPVVRFLDEHGLSRTTLRDPGGRVWRRLSGQGLPVNLVWGRGQRQVELGPRDLDEWRARLLALGCGAAREQDP